MKNKGLIFAGLVIVVVAIFMLMDWSKKTPEVVENEQTAMIFIDGKTLASLIVNFDSEKDTATIIGAGYEEITLEKADSDKGDKYVHETEKLELLHDGNMVVLKKAGKDLFTGTIDGKMIPVVTITDGTWTWVETRMDGASTTKPVKADAFTVTFNKDDETVNGTTDCNGFSGKYTLEDKSGIGFGAFNSTKMACQDSQEMEFMKYFEDVNSYTVTNEKTMILTFVDQKGFMLFKK